ncbi:winged helix DNA-binding domain-containing protein [Micromonospora sp. NPDC050187]|uniref:winged helix DNA-binding domain-containing protein n=1 Tax=Micromonospora sp. NPDC050187 TaxID=3364277 RepID=UPI0037B7099A
MEFSTRDALGWRMASLLLRPGHMSPPRDVAGVVEWFGAMQAQDMASGLWSLGVRLPGSTVADVQEALERREALRTWPMRGTVHLVPPRDAHWMLAVLGERALVGAARRREILGLGEQTADRAVEVLGAALAGGGRFTRDECRQALTEAGVDCAGQLLYHLLWYASQRGVLCIAPHVGNEQTFVLLDEWVPDPHRPERDEALATIALRYFRSHGPTTRQDFAGWTGLTAVDARRGIAAAGDALTTVRVDGIEMVMTPELRDAGPPPPVDDLWTLPGFDEYLLGFKDRSLMVDREHLSAIIPGGNGVFQSTVVRSGRVVATWKRTVGRKQTVVRMAPLVTLDAAERAQIEEAFGPYGHFVGQPLRIDWP